MADQGDKRGQLWAVATGEPPALDASDDEKGMYSFARYTAQNDHYAGFFQSWTKTILFLLSKQWMKWNNAQRIYSTDTDVPPWRQQPVTNIVYAVYRTLAAKLTKQKPTLEVVPPSGDSTDRESARLGEAILVHLWRLLKFPAKMKRGIGWFLCTGQVFLRVYFDTEAGKLVPRTVTVDDSPESPSGESPDGEPSGELPNEIEVAADESGEPITDETTGAYSRDPAMMAEGEIALAIEDPFSVRYNPEAIDPDDAHEFYCAKLWPRKKAATHFKVKESDLESGDDDDRRFFGDLISSAAAGPGWLGIMLGGGDQSAAIGSRCLVVEYYHKPCKEYPNGRYWISVGTKKVWPEKGEAELPCKFWPPLVPVLSLPIPGQPQALGALGQVVPLNEQYNTIDGEILEHQVTMARGGKWLVHPEDEGIEMTSDPGQVVASKGYAVGSPPVQADIKALPNAIYEERAGIIDKVRLVLSLSEAETSEGQSASSGREVLVRQEVTDSVLGPDLDTWENALAEVGRRMLVLAQKYYREERSIAIRGERGNWEIRSFMGADLADGLDVRVQGGSAFPWSKAAQTDIKLDILSKFPGLVMDPATGVVDRTKLAEFLDTGSTGLGSFEADSDPDLVEIQREHAMFEAFDSSMDPETALPKIAFWQVHPKHYEGHANLMKRDYERFLRWSPEAQAAFTLHLEETVRAVDEIAAQAGMQPMPEAGGAEETTPPGGGPPNLTVQPGGQSGAPAGQKPTMQPADFAAAQ